MRSRRLRWLGVAAIVAIGLYFVADIVALQYLQSRGAGRISQALAAQSSTLKLGSLPFLPSYLGGHLSGVEAKVKDATAKEGFGVQSIDIRASEIRFGPGKMFSLARSLFSTRSKVTLTEPIAIIEIGEQDLSEFIKRRVPRVGDVQVSGSGIEVRFKLPEREANASSSSSGSSSSPSPSPSPSFDELLTKPARYLPRIEGRHFVLTLTSLSQLGFQYRDEALSIEHMIELPPVPAGMSSDVRLGKGVITIDCEGKTVTLDVGEGPA